MRKLAKQRKETDAEYEEKRTNLSLTQAEMIDNDDYYARKASPIRDEIDDLDLEDRLSDYDDPYQPPRPPPSAHGTGTLTLRCSVLALNGGLTESFRRSEEGGPAPSARVSQQAPDEKELPAPSAAALAHDAPGKQGPRAVLGISAPIFSPQVGRSLGCYLFVFTGLLFAPHIKNGVVRQSMEHYQQLFSPISNRRVAPPLEDYPHHPPQSGPRQRVPPPPPPSHQQRSGGDRWEDPWMRGRGGGPGGPGGYPGRRRERARTGSSGGGRRRSYSSMSSR